MSADLACQADDSPARRVDICATAYIDWTVEVVASFVRNNSLSASEVPALIAATFQSLTRLNLPSYAASGDSAIDSIHENYLVCLEDGKKLKSLRRHLRRAFNMSPEDYRRKWRLPDNYPMVAPAYSRRRSEIARRMNRPKVPGR